MPTTYYSDDFTERNLPASTPLGSALTGALLVASTSYTMTGDEAQNDLVRLFTLPVGAEVQKPGSYTKSVGTVAATCTIDIGDGTDAARYASALNAAAAGVDAFDEDPLFTVTAATQDVYLLFKTLSTPSEGGVIEVRIVYRAG